MPRHKSDPTGRIGLVFDLEERPAQSYAADLLVVPWRIELNGDRLEWQEHKAWARGEPIPPISYKPMEFRDRDFQTHRGWPWYTSPDQMMLRRFADLSPSKDPLAVLEFARRYGVLHLCEHGLPASHNPGLLRFSRNQFPACKPRGWDGLTPPPRGSEPISEWLALSQRARGILSVADKLRTGRPGAQDGWEDAYASTGGFFLEVAGKTVEGDWFALCHLVNEWIQIGQFIPKVFHRNGRIVVRFRCWSRFGQLFGALGMQLMLALIRAPGVAVCSNCGGLYRPDRTPAPFRANFCGSCGRPAAVARAKGRYRKTQRQARELASSGLSVPEIARRLNRSEERIRKWIAPQRKT
jgi:hypothetical protein